MEITPPTNPEQQDPVESKLPDLSKLTLDQIMAIGSEAVEDALEQICKDLDTPAVSGWQSAA